MLWKSSRRILTSVLCCLALGLGSAKYLYIHDETVWTKQSWDALKLKFPLEKLLQEDELAGFESISSKGAFSVATLQEGLEANKAHRTHPLLENSIQEESQLGTVASLMGCKVCHQLVAAVWNRGRQEIHSGFGVPSISKLNRQLWHTCEKEVSKDMLGEWAILLMGAPVVTAAGNGEEGWAYVFKAREQGEKPSDFEQRALLRSCTNLHEGQDSGEINLATELVQKLGEYEKTWHRLRKQAGLGPIRKASVLEHQGTPDGKTCIDYHKQCSWWADKGECSANWSYMVGSDDQKALKGFCRLSCGACSPSSPSGLPEDAGAELQAAAAALLAGVAAGACAEQQHCKGMPGDAHRAMDTAKSGANPNPKNPKTPEAIALERNTWRAQVRRKTNPITDLQGPAQEVSSSDVLPGGLGAAALDEVAANCYYVSLGWWSYELCPGHHLGQFHALEQSMAIDSILSLGVYDAEQARNEGMGQMAWPVLAELDKLAGVELTVPVVLTTYSGGASCDGSRAAAKRSATVQLACSPDADAYMLVREPETCKYVVTLYHPSICSINGYGLRVIADKEQLHELDDAGEPNVGRPPVVREEL